MFRKLISNVTRVYLRSSSSRIAHSKPIFRGTPYLRLGIGFSAGLLGIGYLYHHDSQMTVLCKKQESFRSNEALVSGTALFEIKSGKVEYVSNHAASHLAEIINEMNSKYGVECRATISFSTKKWRSACQRNQRSFPLTCDLKERKGKHGKISRSGDVDFIIHVQGASQSQCIEVVQKFIASLPTFIEVKVDDRYGWKGFSFFSRETPPMVQSDTVIPGSTGGRFALHLRWEFDTSKFNKLNEIQKDSVIGVNEAGELIPCPVSHVSRMKDLPMDVESTTFGRIGGTHGELVTAYASSLEVFDAYLDRITGKLDGMNDERMRYSECKTAQYFYSPSTEELKFSLSPTHF